MNPNSITTIKIRCCKDTQSQDRKMEKGSGVVSSGQFLQPRSPGILVSKEKESKI